MRLKYLLTYRIVASKKPGGREQKISQAICYKLVAMDTMWLQHVGMWSNNNMHTKRQQMSSYTTLIRKWFEKKFFTPVHKHDYNVDFSLEE